MTPLQAEVERVTRLAMAWPVQLELRATSQDHARGEGVWQAHLVCARPGCGQSVFCLVPDLAGGGYVTTTATVDTGIAAHVRQSHPGD